MYTRKPIDGVKKHIFVIKHNYLHLYSLNYRLLNIIDMCIINFIHMLVNLNNTFSKMTITCEILKRLWYEGERGYTIL